MIGAHVLCEFLDYTGDYICPLRISNYIYSDFNGLLPTGDEEDVKCYYGWLAPSLFDSYLTCALLSIAEDGDYPPGAVEICGLRTLLCGYRAYGCGPQPHECGYYWGSSLLGGYGFALDLSRIKVVRVRKYA